MGKVLVTGALGNVGGYVAKYCELAGFSTKVGDIDQERLDKRYKATCETVWFDYTDPSTFDKALEGVDRVFIMRPPHLGKPEDLAPFIQALSQLKALKLVCFLSLIGIEHNPIPPHYKIEKAIEKAGLPYCHIRPSFFMQNVSGIHSFEIKHFNNIVVPVGKALTSFIDAQDIGEIIAHVFKNPESHNGKAYSITGPEALDYEGVAQILTLVLNRPISYANPKPGLALKYWKDIRGLDKTYANVMGMLYVMTRLGTAKKVTTTFEEIMHKKPRDFKSFAQENRGQWE